MTAASNRRTAIGCSSFHKFGEKGIPLGLDCGLKQFPSAFAQEIGERACDCVSTRKLDDASIVQGGASSNGWLDV